MAMVLQPTRLRLTQAIYFGKPQAAVGSGFVKTDGSTPLTNNWNAGNFRITAGSFGLPYVDFMVPGVAAIWSGANIVAGIVTPALAAGGQAEGNNVFVGHAGNTTLTNGPGAVTLASGNVGVGVGACLTMTTGFQNTAVGQDCLFLTTTGYENTSIGSNALGFNITGNENTAAGFRASFKQTAGNFNVAVGAFTLHENLIGEQLTAVGYNALRNTTTGNHVAVGWGALSNNTIGTNNTAVGTAALTANATGGANVAVGFEAGFSNVGGSTNTAIGEAALLSNVNGSGNVGLGLLAGAYELASNSFYVNNQDRVNTAGDKTLSLLYGTFGATKADQQITVNGQLNANASLNDPWTADSWTRSIQIRDGGVLKWIKGATYAYGIGQTADKLFFFNSTADTAADPASYLLTLDNNKVGVNTAFPTRTLDVNGAERLRGVVAPAVSEANSGVMYFDSGLNKYRVSMNGSAYVDLVGSGGVTGSGVAGKLTYWTAATNLTDEPNITLGGAYTLDVNGDINISTTGLIRQNGSPVFYSATVVSKMAVGGLNADVATMGDRSTAVGVGALGACTGVDNTGVGSSAAIVLTTGVQNTAVGSTALQQTTTGNNNAAFGAGAGFTNTTGSNNVLLGDDADVAAGNLTNAVAIGYQASVAASDAMVLGNGSMNVGIRTSTPVLPLDVNGAIGTRHHDETFVNGANQDFPLTLTSFVRAIGPGAPFNIGGFANGVDGRVLFIRNTVAFQMTLNHLDAGSAASNQIITPTAAPVNCSVATLIFDDTSDKWILLSSA